MNKGQKEEEGIPVWEIVGDPDVEKNMKERDRLKERISDELIVIVDMWEEEIDCRSDLQRIADSIAKDLVKECEEVL